MCNQLTVIALKIQKIFLFEAHNMNQTRSKLAHCVKNKFLFSDLKQHIFDGFFYRHSVLSISRVLAKSQENLFIIITPSSMSVKLTRPVQWPIL